ncbi:cysteine dioxygenase type I [Motilibacter rhizosphaerae]|uniref:Cysteine dioxygenase type I n=1 Tax=Motilibacter rhizosphaerae TaxID=598652 RepID=A0A4Q7NQA3_9ACTN|nr:cysteine dioxygenase family protein [Motilibacter rhizosphaerae]RZS87302.1 cysteine dioxygenase type I [Motilibacter rhizosphaerae]
MTAPSLAPARTPLLPAAPASPARADLLDLAVTARAVARASGWRDLVQYDPAERWYVRLVATDAYEAWLLSWLPGQSTGPHDHGGSSGAMLVLQGSVAETTFAGLGGPGATSPATRTLPEGTLRPFGQKHVHDVAATGGPAVTMHVYAPALRTMTRYAWAGDRLVAGATERAGADW